MVRVRVAVGAGGQVARLDAGVLRARVKVLVVHGEGTHLVRVRLRVGLG